MNRTRVYGNTYPVKDALKVIGARWNGEEKAWYVPSSMSLIAMAIVECQNLAEAMEIAARG